MRCTGPLPATALRMRPSGRSSRASLQLLLLETVLDCCKSYAKCELFCRHLDLVKQRKRTKSIKSYSTFTQRLHRKIQQYHQQADKDGPAVQLDPPLYFLLTVSSAAKSCKVSASPALQDNPVLREASETLINVVKGYQGDRVLVSQTTAQLLPATTGHTRRRPRSLCDSYYKKQQATATQECLESAAAARGATDCHSAVTRRYAT